MPTVPPTAPRCGDCTWAVLLLDLSRRFRGGDLICGAPTAHPELALADDPFTAVALIVIPVPLIGVLFERV
jgi:hypothetical protein